MDNAEAMAFLLVFVLLLIVIGATVAYLRYVSRKAENAETRASALYDAATDALCRVEAAEERIAALEEQRATEAHREPTEAEIREAEHMQQMDEELRKLLNMRMPPMVHHHHRAAGQEDVDAED